MRGLGLSVLFVIAAQPAWAAPLYECTSTQLRYWDNGELEHVPAMDERVASGVLQFRLDPELGMQLAPLQGDDWSSDPRFFAPTTVVGLEGVGGDKAKLLATTNSGADSIRIVTEGDALAFVWTQWSTVETGTCIIIEGTTE